MVTLLKCYFYLKSYLRFMIKMEVIYYMRLSWLRLGPYPELEIASQCSLQLFHKRFKPTNTNLLKSLFTSLFSKTAHRLNQNFSFHLPLLCRAYLWLCGKMSLVDSQSSSSNLRNNPSIILLSVRARPK